MFPKSVLFSMMCVLAMLAVSCGSDTSSQIVTSDDTVDAGQADENNNDVPDDPADDEENDGLPEGPIPVESDGGIGDGAEPLPGAADPGDQGTWHGAQVAETNCPGMEWKRVQAENFSFSVPADFAENNVEPIDSEVGVWTGGNKIEVNYDYGWYSGSISAMPGAENEPIDYSGIVGERTIVRDSQQKAVSVYFGQVALQNGEWDKLSMLVQFTDINDEIIGRCIVGSIEWN